MIKLPNTRSLKGTILELMLDAGIPFSKSELTDDYARYIDNEHKKLYKDTVSISEREVEPEL